MKRLLLFAIPCCFLYFGSSFAYAEESVAGKGTIEYELDTSATPPYHPEFPGIELDHSGTGMSGPLSIDLVSNFYFNQNRSAGGDVPHKISFEDEVYHPQPFVAVYNIPGNSLPNWNNESNFIQVTDKRGSNNGWKLYAQQLTNYQTTTGQELEGTSMSFIEVDARANAQELPDEWKPEAYNFDLSYGSNSVVVAKAIEGKGMGTWAIRLGGKWKGPAMSMNNVSNPNISLFIPGAINKFAEEYQAEIMWSLISDPS